MGKIDHANTNQKKNGVTILIPEKEQRKLLETKRDIAYWLDIIMLNEYVPNNRAPKYMK